MIEIPVYSNSGEQVSTFELDETLVGGELRPALLKQAYVMFHANKRQGTAANRNRALKEGSTRKLFKQKGSGRARRGNVRTNVMRGGGVAFDKQAKSWRQSMPKKMRRLANRNAILAKALDGEIKIIDKLGYGAPRTKQFVALLEALKIDRSCLLALKPEDRVAALSARNIEDVQTTRIEQLNVYDLLSNRYLLVELDVLKSYLEGSAFAQPTEQEAA